MSVRSKRKELSGHVHYATVFVDGGRAGRAAVPILDPEVNVSDSLVCPQSEKEYYQDVFFPKGR